MLSIAFEGTNAAATFVRAGGRLAMANNVVTRANEWGTQSEVVDAEKKEKKRRRTTTRVVKDRGELNRRKSSHRS